MINKQTIVDNKDTINSKDLIEAWGEFLSEDKNLTLPSCTETEAEMLTWLLFHKTPEFRVWIVKKEDEKLIKRLIEGLEAERHGSNTKRGSVFLRRIQFMKELINSGFNAAEAARRCGYSAKSAKQIGYQILKRKHPINYLQ